MSKIKEIRLQKQMTQFELSLKSGLVQPEISRFEKLSSIESITLKSLCKIAKGLDVRLWYIIENENLIDMLYENINYESGIILNGDKSPIAEILESFDISQSELSKRCKIPVIQLSRWKNYGMDNTTLTNFLKVGNALKINIWLLVWDADLQEMLCEVL
jgi:transcriptional regulator with XRE-family HTH domain